MGGLGMKPLGKNLGPRLLFWLRFHLIALLAISSDEILIICDQRARNNFLRKCPLL